MRLSALNLHSVVFLGSLMYLRKAVQGTSGGRSRQSWGFIACGATNGCYSGNCPPQYEQDAWVVKVDSLGCIVPGCNDFGTAITEQITNYFKQAGETEAEQNVVKLD